MRLGALAAEQHGGRRRPWPLTGAGVKQRRDCGVLPEVPSACSPVRERRRRAPLRVWPGRPRAPACPGHTHTRALHPLSRAQDQSRGPVLSKAWRHLEQAWQRCDGTADRPACGARCAWARLALELAGERGGGRGLAAQRLDEVYHSVLGQPWRQRGPSARLQKQRSATAHHVRAAPRSA